MAIVDLFSKRQLRLRSDMPDVYVYDELPRRLRAQIVHIIQDAFGSDSYSSNHASAAYSHINNILCREHGVFTLTPKNEPHDAAVLNFFLCQDSVEMALDVVELSFGLIDTYVRRIHTTNATINPDNAISDLNGRFKEAGVGYQFESGELIRVDSQFIHTEIVKPALELLLDEKYRSANEEFLSAHEHYRHKKFEESVTDCLKAIESLLKIICTNRGWEYQPKDNASRLIHIVLQNDLIPSFMDSQLNVMKTLLESGVPTIRNKIAGHGQGITPRSMPEYIASYTIHLTATTLLLLANADAQKIEESNSA